MLYEIVVSNDAKYLSYMNTSFKIKLYDINYSLDHY